MSDTLDGWYVSGMGELLDIKAEHTTNPEIVKLEGVLGLVVVNRQFFEVEGEAREQARANAQETIDKCEQILEDLEEKPKPSRSKTQPASKSWFTKKSDRDPFGPPDFGVNREIKHKKRGYKATIVGHSEANDGSPRWMLKTPNDVKVVNRTELDEFEAV